MHLISVKSFVYLGNSIEPNIYLSINPSYPPE